MKFYPAWSGANLKNIGKLKNGYEFCWWNRKKSLFFHPNILISYYYGRMRTKQERANLREAMELDDDVNLMLDSGGFSIMTGKMNHYKYSWEEVLDWQEKQNAQLAVTLDLPPYAGAYNLNVSSLTKKEVEKRMRLSVDNSFKALQSKKKKDMMLLFTIHGKTYKDVMFYINLIKEKAKEYGEIYEGFAVSPKPATDLLQVIIQTFAIRENFGDRYIHALGISGFKTINILAYLNISSYDSISYYRGAMGKDYLLPFSLPDKTFIGEKYMPKWDDMPCNCPVCQNFSYEEFKQPGTKSGLLMSLHNLYWYISYNKFIDNLSKDRELFINYIKKKYGDLMKLIEFIDFCKEYGLEEGVKRYVEVKDGKMILKERVKPILSRWLNAQFQ